MVGPIALAGFVACGPRRLDRGADYDYVLRNGLVVDGTGAPPYRGDVAIKGDRIAAVGAVDGHGREELDVHGQAITPGFVNMLSWATESLIADGRGLSDLAQGVTVEIFGEGNSMGPLNDRMKAEMTKSQVDIHYDITWTTLREYLDMLQKRGITLNVGSFVGAATVRDYVVGQDNRVATAEELAQMKALVRQAMADGAFGVGAALIYVPGTFAPTDELVELSREAAAAGGMYIAHIRNEGTRLLAAVDETIDISRRAGVRAEIYHFKAGGKPAWPLLPDAIARVEKARADGLAISANMYVYPAAATGLDAVMPPWVREGGEDKWFARLEDPAIRARVAKEMNELTDAWDNMWVGTGPDGILLVSFKNPALKKYTGKRLSEVAKELGKSPEDTAMDLVVEDRTRVGAIYFSQSEDNVRKVVALPWVSFGSDEGAEEPEGVFLLSKPHPRAYGNIARLFARYVRDEHRVTLQEAVRRAAALPAANLRLDHRGTLRAGNFADVVVLDPATIQDHATFDQPQQLATGVAHVFVNGVPEIRNGSYTGAKAGRALYGPGTR
jgi:N-acyl-D-aspartate/D-glutamate deacylase